MLFINLATAPLLPPLPDHELAPIREEVEAVFREAFESAPTGTVQCWPLAIHTGFGWELFTPTGHYLTLLSSVESQAELRLATDLLRERVEAASVAFVVGGEW